MGESRAVRADAEQSDLARRAPLFRTTVHAASGGAAVAAALFAIRGTVSPGFPGWYMAVVSLVPMATAPLSLWLLRRGQLNRAVASFMVSLMLAIFAMAHLTGGVTGPVAVVLPAIPVAAGLTGGRLPGRWVGFSVAVLYLGMALLEGLGVVRPWDAGVLMSGVAHHSLMIATITVMAVLVGAFSSQVDSAFSVARQRRLELRAVSEEARRVAEAERETRLRQERTAVQLRVAVQRYLSFLKRVAAGDYSARLSLEELDGTEAGAQELRTLGEYLNATVDALTKALADMQAMQRRYAAESWAERAGPDGGGIEVRYEDGRIAPLDQSWLPLMSRATGGGDPVVEGIEAVVPVALGGEVVGVVGARRGGSDSAADANWSEDELAVMRAATDQLSQTMESLRLLDQTQRGAARERTISQVAGRVRRELDVEGVLYAAVDEIQQALGLGRVTLRLVSPSVEAGTGAPEDRTGPVNGE